MRAGNFSTGINIFYKKEWISLLVQTKFLSMKSILLLLLLPVVVYSQDYNRVNGVDYFRDSIRVLSNYEKFSNMPGVVHKTTQRPLGTTRNILVSLFTTTDPITNQSASGVKLTYTGAFYSNPFSEGLFIDIDESEEVGKVLKYYHNEIQRDDRISQLALNYLTKNDIGVNAWSEKSGAWSVTLQQCYHLTKYPFGAVFNVKIKDIDDLAELMMSAKSRLASGR
jgi:hypothetical protein